MCPKPDIEEPQRLQQSREPVFNDETQGQTSRGRRGTILTRGSGGGDVTPTSVTGKKTLLGA